MNSNELVGLLREAARALRAPDTARKELADDLYDAALSVASTGARPQRVRRYLSGRAYVKRTEPHGALTARVLATLPTTEADAICVREIAKRVGRHNSHVSATLRNQWNQGTVQRGLRGNVVGQPPRYFYWRTATEGAE